MKKNALEFSIIAVAFCMFAVVGMITKGIGPALAALGLELAFGNVLCRLYALLPREERRIARRARQDARAHHAAQMYRAGVRLSAANPAPAAAAPRAVPDLRVA